MPADLTSQSRRFTGRHWGAVGAAAVAMAAVALAGCGSSNNSGGSTGSTAAPGAGAAGGSGQTITVKQAPGGQMYITDSSGRSLYTLSADSGGKSSCTGQCATIWPPVTGNATAGSGATGTITAFSRSDGGSQVVFNGHPLYTFSMDTAAGQTKGEGINAFGGIWYLVDPSGNPITSMSGGASSAPGGGLYGGG